MNDELDPRPANPEHTVLDLVEVAPGLAMVFSDAPVDGMDLVPLGPTGQGTGGVGDALALGVGATSLVAPALDGLAKAQGLVRLSPGTLEAMKSAAPVVKDGWNLGVLQQGGQFAAQIRWAPATAAQASTVVASMGPALVLLAIEAQLASISRRVDENIELTHKVLQAVHQDQWMTLKGLHDTTLNAVAEAQSVGFVNDHIFATIAAREADLRKQQHLFRAFVTAHLRELDVDPKARREYITKNADQIAADAQGLLMAEWSWYRYQALRAAHIAHDVDHMEENRALLQKLVTDAQTSHVEAVAEVTRLIDELEAQLHLASALSSGPLARRLGGKEQAAAVATAEALVARLAALQGREAAPRQAVRPELTVVEGEAPQEVLEILRWVAPKGDHVLAFADVNYGRISLNNAFLVVTDEHLVLTGQRGLKAEGELDHVVPLHDIRYVRVRPRGKQGPSLDIITKDEDFNLTFDSWAAEGAGLAHAQRLANLLGSVVHLPADEVTTDSLTPQLRTSSQHPILEVA